MGGVAHGLRRLSKGAQEASAHSLTIAKAGFQRAVLVVAQGFPTVVLSGESAFAISFRVVLGASLGAAGQRNPYGPASPLAWPIRSHEVSRLASAIPGVQP